MDKANIAFAADEGDKSRVGVQTVFQVNNIEDTLNLIENNGGKTHIDKTSMGPNMGYIARFIDSEGNLMGIYGLN